METRYLPSEQRDRRMITGRREGQQIEKANFANDSLTDRLMEQICERANLNQAYKRVKANKGAAGIDGMRVEDMLPHIREHKDKLIQSLLDGSYRPQPVRKVEIPKPDGSKRHLGIPTVIDRLIQQAILQVMQPIFEKTFSEMSFGFRPKRSAHQAVKRAQEYVRSGNRVVVDMDLEKFFDRVNHDILMSRIARRIKDKRVLRIIRRFLQAGIMDDGICIVRNEGAPQGGPLSPLLSNIMLDELDKELERRGHKFCRYADDCNIYVRSRVAGARVMSSIKQFLWKRLRLKVNEAKSAVDIIRNRQFLGFRIQNNTKLGISEKSEKRLKDKIRKITKRNRGVKLEKVIVELNQQLRGWKNYFKIVEAPKKLEDLDGWIRRKLRCYRLKQRKSCYPIVKFLRSLGVSENDAWKVGKSNRGWWRLSLNSPVHTAMSNEWFDKLGLIRLSDKTCKR